MLHSLYFGTYTNRLSCPRMYVSLIQIIAKSTIKWFNEHRKEVFIYETTRII